MEDAEVITLEDIKARAQKNFPRKLINKNGSALCLFSATAQGRTDLIHLYESGVKDVTVIDPNKTKLDLISNCFSPDWEYEIADCSNMCRQLYDSNRRFQMVVCDGSNGIIDHIWEELFPLCYILSEKTVILKITGDYLLLRDLDVNKDGIARLLEQLHGLALQPDRMIERSSGKNGTYWVVFESVNPGVRKHYAAKITDKSGSGNIRFSDINFGKDHCVELKDLLAEHGCNDNKSCKSIINAFRDNVYRKERQSIYRVMTSARFVTQPQLLISSLDKTAACFDLNRYNDIDDMMEAARVITDKRGRVNREISKAKNRGYEVKPFHTRLFIPDIHAIHHSKDSRGGKSMKGHYLQTIEQMGGYPQEYLLPPEAACHIHQTVMWGVMKPEDGYAQGEVVTNERLVAYIHLFRYGNHCWYSRIMGHADFLQDGIMYLLHFTIAGTLLDWKHSGLRYIFYGGTGSGPKDGSLTKWKRRGLFEPRYPIYNEAGEWSGNRGITLLV